MNESFRDKMKSLKDQTSLSDAEKKTKREALHQQHKEEISAVLTAEQRAQAAATKKDWKGKGGDARKGDRKDGVKSDRKDAQGGRGRGGDMAKELNLTTDQQAKVAAIRTENKAKLDAVRNDASLTQEQKRSKVAEIMKAQGEQMKSVLTTEQQQKMKEARKARPAQTKK
jgi:Spy/CpxP family protein refolding chaperone